MKLRVVASAVGMVLLMVLGTACGSDADPDPTAGKTTKARLKVGLSLPAVDEYYSVVLKGVQDEAKKKGVTLLTANGTSAAEPSTQISKIQDLLVQGIKYLVISAPGDAFVPVLDKAVAQGVKVILIDQKIESWTKQSSFIGTDSGKGATLMGEYLAQRLGGKGEVGVMDGIPGLPLAIARYENLKKVLEKAGIKVSVASQADGCQVDQAVPVVKNFLTSHPDVTAIYSICGPTGTVVDKILKERGDSQRVLSTSWDVLVAQINNILAGTETAAVAQFPAGLGAKAIDVAIDLEAGKTVPAYIDSGTEIVTKENASEFFHEGNTGYSYKLSN